MFYVTVFGWIEDSYTGMEWGSAHTLLAGYLKGGEQANILIVFDVISKVGTAREYARNFVDQWSIIIIIMGTL